MPVATPTGNAIERRLLGTGSLLMCFASLLCWMIAGSRGAVSCLVGGILAAGSMVWLSRTISAVIRPRPVASKWRFLAGYVLRLMLIPLCLYAMLRLHFFSLPAAVAGFAAFNLAIFIEGIREAIGSRH